MNTKQPIWKLIANLRDASPIDHGGYFVFEDETGVYAPEGEWLEAPDSEDEGGTWKSYRFTLKRCTFTWSGDGVFDPKAHGILSDNKYHPEHPAWFAQPEEERATRPQDTTYLSNVANIVPVELDALRALFCSIDPLQRAEAYHLYDISRSLGFDDDPVLLERFNTDVDGILNLIPSLGPMAAARPSPGPAEESGKPTGLAAEASSLVSPDAIKERLAYHFNEAAKLLGICRDTLWRAMKRRKLHPLKGQRLISREELMRYLREETERHRTTRGVARREHETIDERAAGAASEQAPNTKP